MQEELSETELNLDVLFAIQAGSDTTSGVLTLSLYHILANAKVYTRLANEVRDAFPSGYITADDHPRLLQLPYLSSVVTEALRLGSPFPGLPRVAPKDGIVIDGMFIPGGTIVGVPAWAQHMSPDNFWPDPERFVPERWLDEGQGTDSIANKNAIMTFSSGPFGCLGKALAIKELYVVIAQLLVSCDLTLGPKFDHKQFYHGIKNMRTTIFTYPLTVSVAIRDADDTPRG
ncbi:cytochrome P450 [Gloeophyllum trabeum ATCC 11539]|uniref:Cytochrome P450 n=1 Tax=Gloeophyllum trabeum (strain ATCC 11539 / FP-39264 / Madison 617) TaxID=670483 RepID=S7RUF2_GLOTA|nr:cytochrome P450 [Gloeophyllum trabeum ATCC 11539]EPQ56829.1 cytochrome P450 [Gloeophyllum trabeum ATCC 11539]